MQHRSLRFDAEEDEPFIETFSLLESIVRAPPPPPRALSRDVIIEVIHYRDGQLVDVMRVPEGAALHATAGGRMLLRAGRNRARLRFLGGDEGTIVQARKWRSLASLARPENLSDAQDGSYEITLRPGEYGQLRLAEGGYLVRFVRRLADPPARERTPLLARRRSGVGILVASALMHFIVLGAVALALPKSMPLLDDDGGAAPPERFRRVALTKPIVEPPKLPAVKAPSKPAVNKTAPARPSVVHTDRQVTRTKKASSGVRSKSPVRRDPGASAAKQVLAALSSMRGKLGRERVALAFNVATVRAASGAAGYRIAGALRKLPGRIALGGSARDGGTGRYARRILASGVGGLRARRGTGTRVRGHVQRLPVVVHTLRCWLSRAAIQRVVMRHMRQIQACYERELINHPGLSGKLVLDWEINGSGGVINARAHSSTINARVAGCVVKVVRRMRFPKPRGGPGTVKVRYPFIFRAQTF